MSRNRATAKQRKQQQYRYGYRASSQRSHTLQQENDDSMVLGPGLFHPKTEVATGYQKRFAKNRDRLFTFLDHDGVPWNNNNAEHAIKAFARLRNIFGGTSTVKGMREYLILLSISETCKNKGVRFLDFLLSGESDVDRYSARPRRLSKPL